MYRPHKNGVDDLVLLQELTNETIGATLRQHFAADEIYVYIGHVLISLNPYKEIRNLYTEANLKRYRGRLPYENPPHVYALAESVHRTMAQQRDNHCVIISGESGAGKTEASKKIMEYIAAVSSQAAGVVKVKQQILESNPLLEAFGNAKTLRNDNSSRFGKYFEIQFDHSGDPVGGNIRNYLLEKIRVVSQNKGERNFHVFYQLLAGASQPEQRELELFAPKFYNYLNQSDCFEVSGVDDRATFEETRTAMTMIGMTPADQAEVFRTVAAILHVGNIQFSGDAKAAVANPDVAKIAARLLQVPEDQLTKALTNKTIDVNRDSVATPLDKAGAAFARDSLAKSIYGRLFDWIVVRCNGLMFKDDHEGFVIGVLDIYGFEIFQSNSFEQLCINFCNEKLHQIFIELTLKAEQEEYRVEGIKWEDVQFYNNKPCVELIERKTGVLGYLDEECVFPKGTDKSFLDKLIANIKSHPNFDKGSGKDNFVVKHYAGEVRYVVDGFLEKNKDLLYSDAIRMLAASKSALLRSLFERDLSLLKDSKKRPLTAGAQFRNQMQSLMDSLCACTPHYIRCIKPNTNKRAGEWNDELCVNQIKYLGLLENVRVRRAGYAFRLPFGHFLRRYKMLSKKTWPSFQGDAKDGCRAILTDLNIRDDIAVGTTKIFIKSPESVFKLEEQREKSLDWVVTIIQRNWRSFAARKWYLELRATTHDLFYGKKQRRAYSINRKFSGDQLMLKFNKPVQTLLRKQGDTTKIVFADHVLKVNRKFKKDRRVLVITNKAIYILDDRKYTLVRRIDLGRVTKITLSELADNYIALHVDGEYDQLLENIRKTEIAICLREVASSAGRKIDVAFANEISFRLKSKKLHTVRFSVDASAPEAGVLVPQGEAAAIRVPAGLPNTSAPKVIYRSKAKAASAAGAGTDTGADNGKYGQAGVPSWGASPAPPVPSTQSRASRMPAPPSTAPPARRGSTFKVPTATALFEYSAETDEELSFAEGDVIEIVKRDASGWWTGRLRGKLGYFPGNYVKETVGAGKLDRANYPYGA